MRSIKGIARGLVPRASADNLLTGFAALPERIVDDAQLRNRDHLPRLLGIDPGHLAPCPGVFNVAAPVPG